MLICKQVFSYLAPAKWRIWKKMLSGRPFIDKHGNKLFKIIFRQEKQATIEPTTIKSVDWKELESRCAKQHKNSGFLILDNQRKFWRAQRHMIRLAVANCGLPVAWWGQHTETITAGRSLSACVWLPPTHAHTDSSSHITTILTLHKNRMTL